MQIEQALYGSDGREGYHFLARSPGFSDDWLPEAERLCTAFGQRRADVCCPLALFARPFGKRHVAVVQVADQGNDDAGRPGALGFYLLIVPRGLYADLGGDLFFLAEQYPPPWSQRGELPALIYSGKLPPRRTVEDLRRVLDVPNSATLLGGAQALLDGGRLAFERTSPDPRLVHSLWSLLPNSTRAELWPATFAFANDLHFHVAVVPRADGPSYEGYVFEEQSGDYPEGRFELALQTAVESANQRTVDGLLSRRSRSQSMTLALTILAVMILGPLIAAVIVPGPAPRPKPSSAKAAKVAAAAKLPDAKDCPKLNDAERAALASRLTALAQTLELEAPSDSSILAMSRALQAIDTRLGTPDATRETGPLSDLGPIQRQLRAVLWKHDLAGYDDPRLNPSELVEKLEEALADGRINAGPREISHD